MEKESKKEKENVFDKITKAAKEGNPLKVNLLMYEITKNLVYETSKKSVYESKEDKK